LREKGALPKNSIIGLLLLFSWAFELNAQTQSLTNNDTVVQTAQVIQATITQVVTDVPSYPDPIKVVWWAAAIPGYGQILNGKYWKLPIVYGGFLGCYYAINWNSNRYVSYKNGYLDITDGDNTTNSFLDLIPEGRTIDSYGGVTAFTSLLKSGMDRSRYYRDLSVIISVAYYGLTIIDAFVDAHLADFDISPDLSLNLRPVIQLDQTAWHTKSPAYSVGVSGRIKF
jgi:hypothetical protein